MRKKGRVPNRVRRKGRTTTMSNLLNRLRQLEGKRFPPPSVSVGLAYTWHRVDAARKQNLADGERIGVDWYREWNRIASGRERITSDPNDQGRRCKRGGYLLDVLQHLHQSCEYRL